MSRITAFILLIAMIFFFSCTTGIREKEDTKSNDKVIPVFNNLEKYRPVFHFTPPVNWINDPNGLVYLDGEYHLFYQYNPFGDTWGHMSWGHAISADLINWNHLPVALFEEDGIMIFSGSAVVDKENTSGFCNNSQGCIMAIYTSHIEGKAQHQSIAYSRDKGRTWKKYVDNPVLDIAKKDFRDPKVFWYEPEQKWVMVVSVPLEYKVQFYQSKDLTDWRLTGEFGKEGDTSKIWECPDMLQVPVENSKKRKWVLIISSGSKYGDFTGMQYFTGNFDGQKFVSDQTQEGPQWLDQGKDFYAAITYNNLSADSKPLLIGWVNNWRYAGSIPTSPWRGMMSIPRELTIRNVNDRLCLIQKPVSSLDEWLDQFEKSSFKNHPIEENDLLLNNFHATAYRMKLVLENIDAEEFGIALLKSNDKKTILGYNVSDKILFLDRKNSGDVNFHEDFSSVESVEVDLTGNQIDLDILIDRSVVEVFANDGLKVITDQVFPEDEGTGLQLYAKNGRTRVVNLELVKIH